VAVLPPVPWGSPLRCLGYADISLGMTTPVKNATQVVVDDSDPALQYSSTGWHAAGAVQEYGETSHGAENDGASVSYAFSGMFNVCYPISLANTYAGTSISVYGTADSASCSMQYMIDSQNFTLTTTTVSFTSYDVPFFAVSPSLPEKLQFKLTFGSHLFCRMGHTISRSHEIAASQIILSGLTT
jgi:hypothetical protein